MSNAETTPRAPVEFPERPDPFDLSGFVCPRCSRVIAADSYGPCPDCIAELMTSQRTAGTEAAAAAYEPKMNVTPNAVALKDD